MSSAPLSLKTKVRQSALHYIYARLQHGDLSFSEELFWCINQEKRQLHFRRCLAKMICHVARNSQDSFRLLESRSADLMEAGDSDLSSAMMREDLGRYMEHSTKLENSLIALGYALSDKRNEDSEALFESCSDIFRLCDILSHLSPDLLVRFADYPAYREYTSAIEAVLKRRTSLLDKLRQLAKAEDLPAEGEYKALVHAAHELAEIKPAAQDLAHKVLAMREYWEELLEPLLNNYSLARLDQLDKCILFLMLYELKVLELPLPVVVNEATSLANCFSGSKSAPFIHGILASASKAEFTPPVGI